MKKFTQIRRVIITFTSSNSRRDAMKDHVKGLRSIHLSHLVTDDVHDLGAVVQVEEVRVQVVEEVPVSVVV